MNVRREQRFQNFENTLIHLKKSVEIIDPDIIQRAGIIRFFEIYFELSRNVMKDYFEEQGYSGKKSPGDTFKKHLKQYKFIAVIFSLD